MSTEKSIGGENIFHISNERVEYIQDADFTTATLKTDSGEPRTIIYSKDTGDFGIILNRDGKEIAALINKAILHFSGRREETGFILDQLMKDPTKQKEAQNAPEVIEKDLKTFFEYYDGIINNAKQTRRK